MGQPSALAGAIAGHVLTSTGNTNINVEGTWALSKKIRSIMLDDNGELNEQSVDKLCTLGKNFGADQNFNETIKGYFHLARKAKALANGEEWKEQGHQNSFKSSTYISFLANAAADRMQRGDGDVNLIDDACKEMAQFYFDAENRQEDKSLTQIGIPKSYAYILWTANGGQENSAGVGADIEIIRKSIDAIKAEAETRNLEFGETIQGIIRTDIIDLVTGFKKPDTQLQQLMSTAKTM